MRRWLAVALTLICAAVFGHGSEQWIRDAKLVDPVTKGFCCGPTDCSVLALGSVERVQGGYKVNTGWWKGYDPSSSHGIVLYRSHLMGTTISVSPPTPNRAYRRSDASSCRRMQYDRPGIRFAEAAAFVDCFTIKPETRAACPFPRHRWP